MTQKGKEFTELVFSIAHRSFEARETAEINYNKILSDLEKISINTKDSIEVLNKLGPIKNQAFIGDVKNIICKALFIYTNYDFFSPKEKSYIPYDRSWYGSIIINTLIACVSDCDISEAYDRMGDFVS